MADDRRAVARGHLQHREPAAPGRRLEVRGWVARGFEGVVEEFARNFSERGEIGASFAAHVDGEPVVDLWGGIADRRLERPWQADTLVCIFSGTKGLVAACLALLLDRGQLDLNAPVSVYWPEFAANGKGGVRVADVVSHQAGLPALSTPVSVEEATDDVRMAELLAAQPPISPPGTGLRYHALTFGWICGELIRRIDGRSIGRFLREEVAEPLELDLWIGLPERHEPRVAMVEHGADFAAEQRQLAVASDPIAWSVFSNPPRFRANALAANLRSWHAAEIPATNGIVAARSLSRLYGCLARGGGIDGMRLLSPETIELARRRLASGIDHGVRLAYGAGFELQTPDLQLGSPPDAFGHTGAGGSVHGAWPSRLTGFSYTPNLLGSFATRRDPRSAALLEALHGALAREEPGGLMGKDPYA